MKLNTLICFILLILISINVHAQTAEEIWKIYSNKDFEKTIVSGQQALQTDSENPQINSAIGRAFVDLKKHDEAIPYLIKGTAENNNPAWARAWSYGYLGLCYYITDNFLESKKNFNECINLNATNNSTQFALQYVNSLQMSETFDSWEIVEKENIRFHFQNKSNITDFEDYIKNREEAYVNINKFFGATLFKKIDFFVWDKPDEAKKIFGQELGFANSNLCIINSRNNQTRGHEITHILSDYGIQPLKKTKLINEGVAVYFDQTNRDRIDVAKKILENGEIKIIDLWNNSDKYPDEYNYAIGGALIEFLINNGTETQLKALLKNQTTETAIKVYDDFNVLILAFEQKLNK